LKTNLERSHMSCDHDQGCKKYFCPFSAGMEFAVALQEARAMIASGDEKGALRLLQRLERRYMDASEMFLMMGEVLERIGESGEGAGYKTFYEVLRGAFRSKSGEAREDKWDPHGLPESRITGPINSLSQVEERAMGLEEAAKQRRTPERDWRSDERDWRLERRPEPEPEHARPREKTEGSGQRDTHFSRDELKESLYPVTAAMGMEFLRQGHFGRAVEIFDMLVERNPDDRVLRDARERARRKMKEKKVLDTLQGWLGNAKLMKAQDPKQ
jgi:tetratricopeptide (TPR) repeat protein